MATDNVSPAEQPRAVAIASRFRHHRREIRCHLNLAELEPHLRARSMLTAEDRSHLRSGASHQDKVDYVLNLVEHSSLYTQFLESVQNEKAHCGHEYIAALLEGSEYCSDEEIRISAELKDKVVKSTVEMMDIDVQTLIPHLTSRLLLTRDETRALCEVRNQKPQLLLLDILDTKGPLAYPRFVHCLSQEKTEPVHSPLYELLTNSVFLANADEEEEFCENCPAKRQPSLMVMEGALVKKEYKQRFADIKVALYSGDWEAVRKAVDSCLKSEIPEVRVVGLLEDVIGMVFRCDDDRVLPTIRKAQEICKTKITGSNALFLEARAEYILSGWYRYLKQYDKAQEHAETAMVLLFNAEPGEDRAYANYNHACAPSTTTQLMISEFQFAADTGLVEAATDSSSKWCHIVANQSLIRIAMLSLGSTLDVAGISNTQDNITKANASLSSVNFKHLTNRIKCQFYQAKSDLYMNMNERDSAIKMATRAQELATRCGFVRQLSCANTRLMSLKSI